MMMVDDVVARFRTKHDRDHVLAKEFAALSAGDFAPALALGGNLAHADGDLGGAEIANGDGGQDRFANHIALLEQNSNTELSASARQQIKVVEPDFRPQHRMAFFRRSASIASCTGCGGRQQGSASFLQSRFWRRSRKAGAPRNA